MRIASRLACFVCALAVGAPALAEPEGADLDFSLDRGLRVRWPEQDASLRLGGRLHLDAGFIDDDEMSMPDNFDVRRGRVYLDGRWEDWRAKVEFDFAHFSSGWRNVWLGYEGFPNTWIRLGNHTAPFGLEENTSSNDLLFAERALPAAFTPSFGTGLMAQNWGRLFRTDLGPARWTLGAGVYTAPFYDTDYDRHRSKHVSVAGRATFAPFARRRRVLQLGASAEYRDVLGDDTWRVSRRPESALAPVLFGSTLSNVAAVTTVGGEAAAMFGPVLIEGEYMHAFVDRTANSVLSNPDFQGAYAQASWVVTGEHHRYSKSLGSFGPVRPRHWLGALELAARWSWIDLTDEGVPGGKATDITAGVGWWLRENMRLMFNYIHVNGVQGGTLVHDDPQIFQFRVIVAL
jgi:phosphate-selective porin OprO and OprP